MFDFESGNDFEGLGRTFQSLLARRQSPEELSYGLRLAAFFNVLRGSEIAPLYLDALTNPAEAVRDAATEVADKVALGAKARP